MVAFLQLVVGVMVGLIVFGIANAVGAPDPWPIVLGVIAFCVCLGVSVIFVDGDIFD